MRRSFPQAYSFAAFSVRPQKTGLKGCCKELAVWEDLLVREYRNLLLHEISICLTDNCLVETAYKGK